MCRFVGCGVNQGLHKEEHNMKLSQFLCAFLVLLPLPQGIVSDQERKKMKRKGDRYSMQTSLIVATLKRLLPVGLNICAPGEQELIALAKNRFTQVAQLLLHETK